MAYNLGKARRTDDTSVALILAGNIEVEQVRWLVQELYITKTASDPEKLDSGLRQRVAYPANVSKTKSGNIHVSCGHNPFLLARLVEGLRVQQNEDCDGVEFLAWRELE